MSKTKHYIWQFIAIVFSVCLVVFTLSFLVTKSSHVVAEIGGDGAKNNFTYVYHSMYGDGIWFDGMNYPYGEHIVYTDGQPVISVILSYFNNITPGKALSVMWLLIGLSYVLSSVYLYKILVHFKVGPLIAMIFAGLICVFSPQLFRLQGHYALAYSCIIPMMFFWTIKYNAQYKFRYCLYFFLAGCLMGFIHPYFAAMLMVWVFSYSFAYCVCGQEKLKANALRVLPLVITVVAVFAVIAITMKLTDPVKDRPVTPLNTFYETCTRSKHIFTSSYSPVWQYIKKKTKFDKESTGGEGYVYLGFFVCLTIVCSVLAAIVKSIRKKRLVINTGDSGFQPLWLLMAFCVLLFSMGIPFIWNMEWLNYLSFFKQFRSLGRFSWVFYYIITVYATVVLWQFFIVARKKRYLFSGYLVLLLALATWVYEASGYVKYSRGLAATAVNNYDFIFPPADENWEAFLKQQQHTGADFQAILMLKFFHVGTEKLWVGNGEWLTTLGSKAAMQLHLPIVDVMMSRSSWGQAKKQVKIAAGPFVDKPILHDIKSRKPFLLLHFEDDSLDADQKYLLFASDYIGHYSQCNVYACYPDRIAASDKKHADSINKVLPFMKTAGDTCITGSNDWFVQHYNNAGCAEYLFGRQSAFPITVSDSIIATIPVGKHADNTAYEFSCWFLLGDKDYRSPYITVQSVDSDGNVIDQIDARSNQSLDNYGMWFRASVYFKMKQNCTAIRCKLINDPKPTYIAMDELLLRPANTIIVSKSADGMIMVNNHVYTGGE